uniref:Uncharacterized protein n=1 Tax=Neogobius melanostomus TaxID=47308 RepID=A0A8C6UTA1_9GOBI
MEVLGDKLLKELPDDAFVVACRFPFPRWPPQSSLGSGLDQTWAYDISAVRAMTETQQKHQKHVQTPIKKFCRS